MPEFCILPLLSIATLPDFCIMSLHTTSLYLIIVLLLLLCTQGSVHGPMLFTMYIKPLPAIIDSHSIIHHSFADDLQPQMSAPPDGISELLHSMQ